MFTAVSDTSGNTQHSNIAPIHEMHIYDAVSETTDADFQHTQPNGARSLWTHSHTHTVAHTQAHARPPVRTQPCLWCSGRCGVGSVLFRFSVRVNAVLAVYSFIVVSGSMRCWQCIVSL